MQLDHRILGFLRRSLGRAAGRTLGPVVAYGLFFGCAPTASVDLRLSIEAGLRAELADVVVEVRRGGCDGAVVYQTSGNNPMPSPRLSPGDYSVVVRGSNQACEQIAYACQPLRLPVSMPVLVAVTRTAPTPLPCANGCTGGRCNPSDASSDASSDATSIDGGRLDASTVDATGLDAVVADATSFDAMDMGSSDAAPTCSGGLSLCNGTCVNFQMSTLHCGGCNQPCAVGQTCTAGTCACPAGQHVCAGACVDRQTNPLHCGACNMSCGAGSCVNGGCVATCNAPNMICSGQCVDTQNNDLHCGGCSPCQNGYRCRNSSCVPISYNWTTSTDGYYSACDMALPLGATIFPVADDSVTTLATPAGPIYAYGAMYSQMALSSNGEIFFNPAFPSSDVPSLCLAQANAAARIPSIQPLWTDLTDVRICVGVRNSTYPVITWEGRLKNTNGQPRVGVTVVYDPVRRSFSYFYGFFDSIAWLSQSATVGIQGPASNTQVSCGPAASAPQNGTLTPI